MSVDVASEATDYAPACTGGDYAFRGNVKAEVTAVVVYKGLLSDGALTTSYGAPCACFLNNAIEARFGYYQERYVQSSGEVFWIFILRNKVTKEIYKTSMGPDHPCFGNGGDPIAFPHPFGDYDNDKYEIIVINPSKEEVQTINEKGGVSGKGFSQTVIEEYEIDEESKSAWPTEYVTTGLPPDWDEAWRTGKAVPVIQKQIPKPPYVISKGLLLK